MCSIAHLRSARFILSLNFSSLQTLAAILQAEPENSDRAYRTRFLRSK
jgi:hypothetical protein